MLPWTTPRASVDHDRIPRLSWICMLGVIFALFSTKNSCADATVTHTEVSCVAKLMRAANITNRQSTVYEMAMKPFSKRDIDMFNHSDAFAPLIFGADVDKGEHVFQCLRDPTVCKIDFPCHNHGRCVFHKTTDRYVCDCPRRYKGAFCENPWFSDSFFTRMVSKIENITCSEASRNDPLVQSQHQEILTSLQAIARTLTGLEDKMESLQRQTEVLKTDVSSLKTLKTDMADLKDFHGITGRVYDGWRLVWKHSYFQVDKSQLDRMKTFSSFRKPCISLADGWCNELDKTTGMSQQKTVAYHKQQIIYSYRGDLNPELGKTWRGAILNNPVKIVDKCTINIGVPPEPSSEGVPGITFDKENPGRYTGNCDTDRNSYAADCRWENCRPTGVSPHTHVQMTIAIFVR